MINVTLVMINIIILQFGYTGSANWYYLLVVTIPLLILGIINVRQKKHAILRNFPVIGYLRYFFESFRPEVRQYFF